MHVQYVFAVQGRQNLIKEENRIIIEKVIAGIVKNRNCKPLATYCNPDHVHILVGIHPEVSHSSLVRDIKAGSSKFINDHKMIKGKFNWQVGYGAFSYAKKDLNVVIDYIFNQAEHHKKIQFRNEYKNLLHKHEIEYNEEYLFEFYDSIEK